MSSQPQTTGMDMSQYIDAAVECLNKQNQEGIKVILNKVMAAQTLIATSPAFQGSGQKIFIVGFFDSVLQAIDSQYITTEEKKKAKDLFIKNFKSIVPKADIKQIFLSNIKKLLETVDSFKAGIKESIKPNTTISALNIKNLNIHTDQTLQEWYSEQEAIKNNNVMSKLYSFVSKAWKGSSNQSITNQQAADIARFIINMDLAKEIDNALITDCNNNIDNNESKLNNKKVQINTLGAQSDEKYAKLIVADALNVMIVTYQIKEGLGVSIKELENIDKLKAWRTKIDGVNLNTGETIANLIYIAIEIISGIYTQLFGTEIEKMLNEVKAETRSAIYTKTTADLSRIFKENANSVSAVFGEIVDVMQRNTVGASKQAVPQRV